MQSTTLLDLTSLPEDASPVVIAKAIQKMSALAFKELEARGEHESETLRSFRKLALSETAHR